MLYSFLIFLSFISQEKVVELHPYFVTEFPSKYSEKVDYVIITTDALKEAFEPLKDWKTEKGINCVIRTAEWINQNYSGCDTPERIRNFLKKAHSEWETKYILLGGDISEVPVRYIHTNYGYALSGGYDFPADMYYSCLQGSWNANHNEIWWEIGVDLVDFICDLSVGRLPGHTQSEIETQINKIFKYERNPTLGYQEKLLLIAGDAVNDKNHCREIAACFPDYFIVDTLFGYPAGSKNAVLDSLGKGYGFIYSVSHGRSNQDMGYPTYLDRLDIDSLNSPLFFMTLVSCFNHWLEWDCLSRRFMLNPDGGSVSFLGNSRVSWNNERELNKYFYQGLFNDSIFSVGELLVYAKNKFCDAHTGQIDSDAYPYRSILLGYLLFGEPELWFWTRCPDSFDVSFPEVVDVGETEFKVIVEDHYGTPVDNACVCVSKKNEVYAKGLTDENGELNFGLIPESQGLLKVTVTKPNFLPFQEGVLVWPQKPYVRYKTYSIDGDGIASAGEEIILSLTLENAKGAEACGVQAKLVSSSPCLIIPDSIQYYGDIPAGGTKTKNYEIQISQDAPGEAVDFSVFLNYSGDSTKDTFDLVIHSPELLHYGHSLSVDSFCMGDTISLSFKIKNCGNGKADAVLAKLLSLDAEISILDSLEELGSIEADKINFHPNCFEILVNEVVENPGFILELEDTLERKWADTFLIKFLVPPDSLFTIPYPNRITIGWNPVPNAYGYNVYRTPDSLLLNPCLITESSVFDDKELEDYEVYSYWVTTVDSFGNESKVSSLISGKTNPGFKDGWPKRNYDSYMTAPMVGDLDTNYHGLEIVIGPGMDGNIFAWHSDGTGVLLQDGVFANVSSRSWTSVALADIDADSNLEVICVPGWEGSGGLYVFRNDGTLLDGFPVLMEVGWNIFSSPSVQDLDGDGFLEIIVGGTNGKVYAFRYNGTPFLNNEDGLFALRDEELNFASPAIADIDRDDTLDVILGGTGKVYAWKANSFDALARNLPGWPVMLEGNASSIAIGDIDTEYSDSGLEVVVYTYDSIYVFHADGTRMPNWPQYCNRINWGVGSSPALGDVDGDGNLEIALAGRNGVCLWNHGGTLVDGWPIFLPFMDYIPPASPVIGDIDGDNESEIIIVELINGNIYAFEKNGAPVLGFPIMGNGLINAIPVLADIDWNEQNELVVATYNPDVRVFEVLGNKVEWGCFAHDRWHTGLYGFVPPDTLKGVEIKPQSPQFTFKLFQNAPNPFNQKTEIRYQISDVSKVSLKIYDLTGRLIRTLVNEPQKPGLYQVKWDKYDNKSKPVASGIYFYRLSTKDRKAITKKLIFLK
ncbi:VCBS repeat-containing protein [candidate division WOR-3 bacterium]|nr:VCBS repeat-containing protein [candidate division WOR-3 bacterium]